MLFAYLSSHDSHTQAAGAKYRIGPELEISGYSCEDHFLESDTYYHCDQSLAAILNSDLTDNILCDIGMPLLHKNVRYNCRIFCLNRKILLIRPKLYLADDGNYRERRYFTAWKEKKEGWGELQEHTLSEILRNATQQSTVPIGIAALETEETLIAAESCEELWAPNSPHVRLMLAGVEIIGNGSGSHHQLRKLQSRLSLVQNASTKCGGAYLYANQRGCDGNRLYFDGTAMICVNGDLVAQGSQFGLRDVEVISATVDLMAVRSYRNKSGSIQEQSSLSYINDMLPIIDIKSFSLRPNSTFSRILPTTPRIEPRIHTPEEECALGPACWLWDYLRRSGGSGFLLPLSGGADSASVAAIVRIMCILVATAILRDNDINVKSELFRIMKGIPLTKITTKDSLTQDSVNCVSHHLSSDITDFANEICGHILHTVYLGTENSSKVTRSRAQRLSESIGAYHNAIDIDIIVSAVLRVFSIFILDKKFPGAEKKICYSMHGGTDAEDIALQNIQARLRMVMSYLCAQLFPWVRGKKGFLLVLGSANVDESLRGYMTKYDCSSADLNPIGGISKGDLKNMMKWISQTHNIPILEEIAGAAPTVSKKKCGNKKNSLTLYLLFNPSLYKTGRITPNRT